MLLQLRVQRKPWCEAQGCVGEMLHLGESAGEGHGALGAVLRCGLVTTQLCRFAATGDCGSSCGSTCDDCCCCCCCGCVGRSMSCSSTSFAARCAAHRSAACSSAARASVSSQGRSISLQCGAMERVSAPSAVVKWKQLKWLARDGCRSVVIPCTAAAPADEQCCRHTKRVPIEALAASSNGYSAEHSIVV